MTVYYCNACGFEFTEEEAYKHDHNPDVIICPMCGAERWDDDDDPAIERFNGDENEEE